MFDSHAHRLYGFYAWNGKGDAVMKTLRYGRISFRCLHYFEIFWNPRCIRCFEIFQAGSFTIYIHTRHSHVFIACSSYAQFIRQSRKYKKSLCASYPTERELKTKVCISVSLPFTIAAYSSLLVCWGILQGCKFLSLWLMWDIDIFEVTI